MKHLQPPKSTYTNASSKLGQISFENQQAFQITRLVLDTIPAGVVLTDTDGYIIYLNEFYGKFLGVNPKKQIGKHCTEVIENTRMHIVGQTGKPEINMLTKLGKHNMVVNRIPITREGETIGVLGHIIVKDIRDLRSLIKRLKRLESKVKLYEQELVSLRSTRYTFDSIIGESDSIRFLKKEALKAAAIDVPVLICGESGTGKELFAHAIHHASDRATQPFLHINCAAIPKDLLESELFGYEKGAFTGANPSGKPGKFELAQDGTIFLDEIGDLSLELQPKLLRVVEEKEFERVGGNSSIKSDFRLIAATNRHLEEMLDNGTFRPDLFYRLNVITLYIPVLRTRKEDIVPLAYHLLEKTRHDFSLPEIKLEAAAEKALVNHDWPGNVRELRNVLERALFSLDGDIIRVCDLHFYRKLRNSYSIKPSFLKATLASAEREAIKQAMAASNNKKTRAAQLLGIHRTMLYDKMKKHGMSHQNHGNHK